MGMFMSSLVIFKASDFQHAFYYLKAFIAPRAEESLLYVNEYFSADVRIALVLGILFCVPISPWLARLSERTAQAGRVPAFLIESVRVTGLMAALLLCSMSLSAGTHNPFIYFRF
jgi:alginate O-acetyltransferase complex protein AlgI